MARVKFIESVDEAQGKAKEAYDKLVTTGKITNMKRALLQDYATFDAFMGWYTSWARLVDIIGQRAATVYAHAVSTTNSCQLCSLFFISERGFYDQQLPALLAVLHQRPEGSRHRPERVRIREERRNPRETRKADREGPHRRSGFLFR